MRNESRIKKILPVDLMLAGRPCLVVGGGQVAARKVGHLLEAGANITVVGPETSEDVSRWITAGRIQHRPRNFRDSDLKGQFLVMAATDDAAVNGRVINLCRRKGILCSSADAHWPEADFLIPATLRRPHVTLTLSTGGESCRRARLLKDYLARHMDILRSADLMVIEIVRRRRTATGARRCVGEMGAALHQIWGIHEFMLLDGPDCFEVWAIVSRDADVAPLLMDCVQSRCPGKGRIKHGAAAMEHVAGRCTPALAGAVQKALGDSVRAGWAGVMVQEWLVAGFRLADKILMAHPAGVKPNKAIDFSKEYQRQYESIIRSI